MSPGFGKYTELVTALVTAFLVVAAVLSHVLLVSGTDLTFIDAAALLALGRVYGVQSAANGYAQMATAAHQRIDVLETKVGISTHPAGTPPSQG